MCGCNCGLLCRPQPLDSDEEEDDDDEELQPFKSAYTATISCSVPDIAIPAGLFDAEPGASGVLPVVVAPAVDGLTSHAPPTVVLVCRC